MVACSDDHDGIIDTWQNGDGNKLSIYKSVENEYKIDVELNQYDQNLATLSDSCSDEVMYSKNSLSCDNPSPDKKIKLTFNNESDNLEVVVGDGQVIEYFYRRVESGR